MRYQGKVDSMTSRTRWLFASAAGLAAILIAFGVGTFTVSIETESPQQRRVFGETPTSPKLSLVAPDFTDPASDCRAERGIPESELCAQWRSAYAAEDSANWAKYSLFVSIIGMFGLFWTLYYTRRALEDTAKATAAGIEANKIAHASSRPYVFPNLIKLFPDDGSLEFPIVNVKFENFGTSIATNLKVGARTLIAPVPLDRSIVENPPYEWQRKFDMPPGGKLEIALPLNSKVAELREEISSRRFAIFVFIYISYMDIIGNNYTYNSWGYSFGDLNGVFNLLDTVPDKGEAEQFPNQ